MVAATAERSSRLTDTGLREEKKRMDDINERTPVTLTLKTCFEISTKLA
jgi:hypothetical protein